MPPVGPCTSYLNIKIRSLAKRWHRLDYADIQSRDPEDRVPNTTVGIGRAMLSNRISHFLDAKGPRYGQTLAPYRAERKLTRD